jgi:hypothetical protein
MSTGPSPAAPFPNTTGIAWAIAVLGVGGLAVIFGTAIPLFTVVPNFGIACLAMLFGFLVLSVGLGALIRHMQRVMSLATRDREQNLPHAAPVAARYIGPKPDGIPSVTEHRTRSIDYPGQRPPSD